MAKTTFKTYEEAQEAQVVAKESLKEAKDEIRAFRKENGIKKDETPEDAKLAGKLDKLQDKVDKAQEKFDEISEAATALKPAKAKVTKYEYPEGMSDVEKKRFRAKLRREAAAGEKEEKPKKEKKAEKEEVKEEKTEKSEKRDKKSKRNDD